MKVHFIGIGGIGVSALSKYYLKKKNKVSGSDLISSEITSALKKQGAKIFIGKHKAKNLPRDTDLVIFSPAVTEDNPELKTAESRNTDVKSYPEALGDLTKEYFTIAVSGTHGKSTTVGMIASVLIKAGLDPTVIVGTKIKSFGNSSPHHSFGGGSNCRVAASERRASPKERGKSRYLVIEADEWKASFLNYWPKIIVLTNIEKEHLDYYKNLGHILKTYKEYINHLPKNGILIANRDDKNVYRLSIGAMAKKIFFSIKQKEAKKVKKVLKVPGTHNVSNGLAALKVARVLGVSEKVGLQGLASYEGSWRRFETIKEKPYILISDYGHHPTEIKATLSAVRQKYPQKKVWIIFQPHQYQRTFYLFKDFVSAFDLADAVVLTKIYDVVGREKGKISKKVSSRKLSQLVRKRGKEAYYVEDFRKIPKFLKNKIKPKEVVLVMGAGDIYKLVVNF